MRKLFSTLFIVLLIISFQYIEHIPSKNSESHMKYKVQNNSVKVQEDDADRKKKIEASRTSDSVPGYDAMSSYNENDLVYRDYGTGIKLSNTSTLTVPQLNLNLDNVTADIYAIDLEHNEVTKVCSYRPMSDVIYSPKSDGVYIIIAKISNGEIVDLTPEAMIETSYTGEDAGGFLLLE